MSRVQRAHPASEQRYRGKPLPSQGQSEDVYVEVILRYRIRPAGWIGNDGWVAEKPLRLLKIIRAASRLILDGDEHLDRVTWRWRRDGDKRWRDEQEVKEEEIP